METVLHVAAGGLHSVAVAVSGQVYDWGLVFEEADHGGGDDSQHALPGMAQLDHRGEYLRRIVMRSAAAYLGMLSHEL
jgi:alpha-tubulin suppressor-like RCC1 family protein